MAALARKFTPERLSLEGFALDEAFRPEIPGGVRGWGAKGILDLSRIAVLSRPPHGAP